MDSLGFLAFSFASNKMYSPPRMASPLTKRSSAAACVMSSSLDESDSPSTAKANWGPGGSSGWSAAKLGSCCTAAGARGSAPKFGCAGCCPNWNGCCSCCSAASSSCCSGGGCVGCAGAGGGVAKPASWGSYGCVPSVMLLGRGLRTATPRHAHER